jgi:hypothetical protein
MLLPELPAMCEETNRTKSEGNDGLGERNRYCDICRSTLRYLSGKQNFTHFTSWLIEIKSKHC